MGKGGVPDRWLDYSNYGEAIEGTRIFALKVPLKKALLAQVDEKHRFCPEMAASQIERLEYVIDLTFTTRYYSPEDFRRRGIGYKKVATAGHVIPDPKVVSRFFAAMDSYLEDQERRGLIGVHCTHGVNRTGYLICRYLIVKLGFSPEAAIAAFNKARGHDQERKNYLDDLRTAGWKENPPVEDEEEEKMRAERPRRKRRHSGERPNGEARRHAPRHWDRNGADGGVFNGERNGEWRVDGGQEPYGERWRDERGPWWPRDRGEWGGPWPRDRGEWGGPWRQFGHGGFRTRGMWRPPPRHWRPAGPDFWMGPPPPFMRGDRPEGPWREPSNSWAPPHQFPPPRRDWVREERDCPYGEGSRVAEDGRGRRRSPCERGEDEGRTAEGEAAQTSGPDGPQTPRQVSPPAERRVSPSHGEADASSPPCDQNDPGLQARQQDHDHILDSSQHTQMKTESPAASLRGSGHMRSGDGSLPPPVVVIDSEISSSDQMSPACRRQRTASSELDSSSQRVSSIDSAIDFEPSSAPTDQDSASDHRPSPPPVPLRPEVSPSTAQAPARLPVGADVAARVESDGCSESDHRPSPPPVPPQRDGVSPSPELIEIGSSEEDGSGGHDKGSCSGSGAHR